MSDKVRIYQLTKELGIDTKQMLALLDSIGVEYKSHSSTLDNETAETVRQLLHDDLGKPAAVGSTAVAEPAIQRPSDPLRPPVVTVMGHVDHGKTSLLDFIRKAKVAEGEAGGITQHIGAYQAHTPRGLITFLDTPGHEAFTTIRQRGATVTDIAVIVVAADDSIMPQTREAIAHAKAAKVPIIVAINKIDLPQANIERVKRDLVKVDLAPEDYGGDTIAVPISAKTGQGIDQLLEMISLVAELEDLRAPRTGLAGGTIIESVLDKRAGVLATVLVQSGTLKVGDALVSGEVWGRVRAMSDFSGARLQEAGPSTPVQVLGFSEQPHAGDRVEAVASDQVAKALVSERIAARQEQVVQRDKRAVTLAELFGQPKRQRLNLVLRADTQGSLEAIKGVLARESQAGDEVEVNVLFDAVGAPTEADLLLASTAEAIVMSFGVTAPGSVKKSAERYGIELRSYRIIYDLIDDVKRLIRGQVEPVFAEQLLGRAEVRLVIKVPRSGNIAGSYVTDGLIRRGAKARVLRGGKEVYKGSIAQLKRFKDDVREVATGFECGINLQNYDHVQEGDVIECYDLVEVKA
jgi:translation initiation factor IF-2